MNEKHERHALMQHSQLTEETTKPEAKDVLLGKSKQASNNPGNEWLRTEVVASLPYYLVAISKTEKTEILDKIIDGVHANGGRFLKRQSIKTGDRPDHHVWHEADSKTARDKVRHIVKEQLNVSQDETTDATEQETVSDSHGSYCQEMIDEGATARSDKDMVNGDSMSESTGVTGDVLLDRIDDQSSPCDPECWLDNEPLPIGPKLLQTPSSMTGSSSDDPYHPVQGITATETSTPKALTIEGNPQQLGAETNPNDDTGSESNLSVGLDLSDLDFDSLPDNEEISIISAFPDDDDDMPGTPPIPVVMPTIFAIPCLTSNGNRNIITMLNLSELLPGISFPRGGFNQRYEKGSEETRLATSATLMEPSMTIADRVPTINDTKERISTTTDRKTQKRAAASSTSNENPIKVSKKDYDCMPRDSFS